MKPNFNFKYYKEDRLILAVVILYLLIEFLVNLAIELLAYRQLSYYRFYPSVMLMAILFGLINSYLDKSPVLWWFFMKTPLIKGYYEGYITYVLDNVTEKKKCSVKIFQTPSKIKVHTSFWNEDEDKNKIEETKTYSESTVEEFFENHSDIFELHFYYSNGGNLNSTIPVRRGYNVLKYNKKTKKFGGFYFSQNSKSQGSGGKMSITFKRKI